MQNSIKIGKIYRDLHNGKYVIVESKKKLILKDLDMSLISCREIDNPNLQTTYWMEDAKTTLVPVNEYSEDREDIQTYGK